MTNLPNDEYTVVDLGTTVSYSTVEFDGIQGPVGPVGPGVPTGGNPGEVLIKAGPNDYDTVWGAYKTFRHVHVQSSPAAQWPITHNLGGRPSVTVVDSAGTMVIGEVSYLSNSEVIVSFTHPFSGSAYLT